MVHARNDGNVDAKDEARTPPSLFKKLDDRFHFDVDVGATEENTLCPFHFDDALERPWYEGDDAGLVSELEGLGVQVARRFFCNPPYSRGNVDRFVKKGYEESIKGATVVMLLPADTSTKVFREYCMKADEIVFVQPRVHFNNPDGTPMVGSPKFGSMVVVFKNNEFFDGSPIISTMDWR